MPVKLQEHVGSYVSSQGHGDNGLTCFGGARLASTHVHERRRTSSTEYNFEPLRYFVLPVKCVCRAAAAATGRLQQLRLLAMVSLSIAFSTYRN